MNIAAIYDQKYNKMLQQCYNKVDVSNKHSKDEPNDYLGYLGKSQWYREQQPKQQNITKEEFISIMTREDKLKEVMFTIRQIDKEHNGYVTRNELEDILKMYMKESLDHYNLAPILNQFSSIQNKILIDYMKFQKWVMQEGKEYYDNLK